MSNEYYRSPLIVESVWLVHEWMIENNLAWKFDIPKLVVWPQKYYRFTNFRGPNFSMIDSDIYYGNLEYRIGSLADPQIFDIIITIIEKWEEFGRQDYRSNDSIFQLEGRTSPNNS